MAHQYNSPCKQDCFKSVEEYKRDKKNAEVQTQVELNEVGPLIKLTKAEIDNVIHIREDRKYCTFIDGYRVTIEKL